MIDIKLYSLLELKGGNVYDVNSLQITGLNLIFMGWESVVYLSLAILYEYWSIASCMRSRAVGLETDNSLKDEDVRAEEERVMSGAADESSTILVKDMKKVSVVYTVHSIIAIYACRIHIVEYFYNSISLYNIIICIPYHILCIFTYAYILCRSILAVSMPSKVCPSASPPARCLGCWASTALAK